MKEINKKDYKQQQKSPQYKCKHKKAKQCSHLLFKDTHIEAIEHLKPINKNNNITNQFKEYSR